MVSVHVSGGPKMLQAATEALGCIRLQRRPLLIGSTVPTSIDGPELGTIGIGVGVKNQVMMLATLAAEVGLCGVECPAQEVLLLRQYTPPGFLLVASGIRPAGGAIDDHARVLTPAEAMRDGADYIIVGRPITRSPDPISTLRSIIGEVSAARQPV